MTPIAEHKNFTLNVNSFPGVEKTSGLFRPKFQNWYAIVWLRQGEGRYFIDFKEYPFAPDTLILISKNQNTSFEFTTPDSEYVVITFAQELLNHSSEDIQLLLSFCIREHYEGKQILKTNGQDSNYLDGLLEQLRFIPESWNPDMKKASAYHLIQLFLLYCNHLKTNQQKDLEGVSHSEAIRQFTKLLESNFKNTQSVHYYTDHLNLTYNSLSRYTAQYCQQTPKEIIVERVILEIKRLLAGSKMSVKEIAYHLGFDEPTNMVKYFKKYTGITPASFRESTLN
ncbi:helix-turn-helix transcriptional regulator [Rapidithrix thailandica]|uniref:Helix-turn-helix transcriptional regulator n=1 Tax=Rapidithrix thailandica TaxID=413964 RepID=A0AAW9S9I8_9BACT